MYFKGVSIVIDTKTNVSDHPNLKYVELSLFRTKNDIININKKHKFITIHVLRIKILSITSLISILSFKLVLNIIKIEYFIHTAEY